MGFSWLSLVIGLVVGAAAAFLWLRSKLVLLQMKAEQAEANFKLEQDRSSQALSQQKASYERLLEESKITEEKLNNSFSTLATSVLDKNAERFKQTAEKDLRQLKTEGTADLDSRVKLFDSAVTDMKARLKEANDRIANFEKERTEIYSRLETQMKQMSEQERKLISETDRLKSALTTSSAVRGRWGEQVLRNILSSSGLTQNIDFEEQSGVGDELKPDFIVRLPQAGQHLVIDSKTSLYESYLGSDSATSEEERKTMQVEFAKKVRSRVNDLAKKEYQKHVSDSLPYVIMFVPGEAAIRAAFEGDKDLFQYAMERKIFIASPVTIIPLIMLVANGWRQFKISSEASELVKVVEVLGNRLQTFVSRLSKVQKGLDAATEAWNEAIDKSWNGQQSVPRQIEKARELGAQISEIQELETVKAAPRDIDGREVVEVTETVVSITSAQVPNSPAVEG